MLNLVYFYSLAKQQTPAFFDLSQSINRIRTIKQLTFFLRRKDNLSAGNFICLRKVPTERNGHTVFAIRSHASKHHKITASAEPPKKGSPWAPTETRRNVTIPQRGAITRRGVPQQNSEWVRSRAHVFLATSKTKQKPRRTESYATVRKNRRDVQLAQTTTCK